MISFDCPKCHQVVTGPETLAGKTAKCAKCRQRLQIPPLPGRTAPPVPRSPCSWGIGSLLVPAFGGAALAALVTLPMVFFPKLNPLNQQVPSTQLAKKKPTIDPKDLPTDAELKAENESKSTAKSTPKVQPAPEPKPKAEPEPKPEPKVEPKPEPKLEPKAEPKPKPKEPADPAPAIATLLASDKPAARLQGANELAKLGEKGKYLTAALIQAMLQSWPANKEEFLDALESINPKLHKPVLTLAIDKDHENRMNALLDIQDLRSEGKNAMPFLVSLFQESQRILQKVRANSRITQIESDNFMLGRQAFVVAAMVDPRNNFVVQTVVSLISENRVIGVRYRQDGFSRRETITPIALALALKIEPKLLVPALTQVLNNAQTRNEAIVALGTIGPEAKDAVPQLKKLRFDSDSTIRDAATVALKNIQGK